MANRDNRRNIGDERIEDVTMYGEFISSFHQWSTLDRQKNKTRYMEEISEEPLNYPKTPNKKRSR